MAPFDNLPDDNINIDVPALPDDAEWRRVLLKFLERVSPEPNTGCWLWMGPYRRRGYGRLSVNGRDMIAHRISYRLFVGELLPGLCVCHRCDVPECVNPDHLFLGTHKDNVADCIEKGRHAHGATHWASGWSDNDVLSMREAYREGAGLSEIVDRFGHSKSATLAALQGRTWTHLNEISPPVGTKFRRLPDSVSAEIAWRYRSGERPHDIALDFGIHRSTVRAVTARMEAAAREPGR